MNYEYQDEVVAVDDPVRDEANLRLKGDTPHHGYTNLVDAADRAGLDLTEYSEGDTVGRARLTEDGAVVEFVVGREPFRDEELYSYVLSHLDGTGGLLDVLANAVQAADEAGFHVETHRDRCADIDNGCQRAFDEIDQSIDDVDADEVLYWVQHAADAANEFRRGLPQDLADFELPDHVDSGVYDTLGGYAEYVHKDLIGLESDAEQFADASA